jgi:hypothetical protein
VYVNIKLTRKSVAEWLGVLEHADKVELQMSGLLQFVIYGESDAKINFPYRTTIQGVTGGTDQTSGGCSLC